MEVQGNYTLNVLIGGNRVEVPIQMIREFTIAQDIDRIAPTFKWSVTDATQLLTNVIPFAKSSNEMVVEFSRTDNLSSLNTMSFLVKRRNAQFPEEAYTVEGLLNTPLLLTTRKCRSFSGSIKQTIESIAHDDLEIEETEVGSSLDTPKNLLQPNWTDAKFFQYLKENLSGRNNESGYMCFIKVSQGIPTLVFKSLDELMLAPVKYKFIVGRQSYQDHYPVSDYSIFDDSGLVSDLNSLSQKYGFFNFETGSWTEDSINISDCPALPEFHLVDKDKDTDSCLFTRTGRSNDFTKDFKGKVRNNFYLKATNLISMWISTWGLENIAPGDVVQVLFSDSFLQGNIFVYQHSGLWLVKRVVHLFGQSFMTNILLTRSGIDTDISTTLQEVENRKQK